MAFVTRVRIEGAGESPDAIQAVFDSLTDVIAEELGEKLADFGPGVRTVLLPPPPRIVEEVYDRVKSDGHAVDWYKGRRVVWFVEPGGANDPDAGR